MPMLRFFIVMFLTVTLLLSVSVVACMHAEHQDRLYEESLKQAEAFEKQQTEKLEEALRPKQTTEDLLEKARLILPQLIDNTKATDQGKINVAEMRRLLKIPRNTAYNLRRELLKELHKNEAQLGAIPSTSTS